jgi:Protein of unknown function (DUF4038)/Putative collagen-binding domain of a collagenase
MGPVRSPGARLCATLTCMRRMLLVSAFVALGAADVFAQNIPLTGPSVDFSHGPLRVSRSHRFLQHADGTPFLYLGDTAWELFHRLTRDETERYLDVRRAQGFTVVQAVVLAEFDGLTVPNAYGELPLVDQDPTRPNDKYFAHVDWVVKKAEEKGLYVGVLPTWGDKVVLEKWGKGPVVFPADKPEIARAWGLYLGRRYKDAPNVIWILGGDRIGGGFEPVWNAMAAGLAEGDGGAHLKTYHPQGDHSSAEWFHDSPWLDFNMVQSGHGARNIANDEKIDRDYQRKPPKPVLDGELRYEDHPVNWNPDNGYFDEFDVRQGVSWSVFAGGFGVTYGCHDVWQFHTPAREPISAARNNWYETLTLPGAWDMLHLRRLLLSRPFLERRPDQSMIEDGAGSGESHVRATRGHAYAFFYIPTGNPITVRLGKISGEEVAAWWFNPRTGAATAIGRYSNRSTRGFTPPEPHGRPNDWVLVLDDADREFQAPGYRVPDALKLQH